MSNPVFTVEQAILDAKGLAMALLLIGENLEEAQASAVCSTARALLDRLDRAEELRIEAMRRI